MSTATEHPHASPHSSAGAPAAASLGMIRTLVVVAAVLAGSGVVMGAFGAHALEGRVAQGRIDTFETGAHYQQVQAVGVLVLAVLGGVSGIRGLISAGWLIIAGIAVFSGSLYLLVLTDTPVLGAVTPLGGLLMIAGWVFAAVAAARGRWGRSVAPTEG